LSSFNRRNIVLIQLRRSSYTWGRSFRWWSDSCARISYYRCTSGRAAACSPRKLGTSYTRPDSETIRKHDNCIDVITLSNIGLLRRSGAVLNNHYYTSTREFYKDTASFRDHRDVSFGGSTRNKLNDATLHLLELWLYNMGRQLVSKCARTLGKNRDHATYTDLVDLDCLLDGKTLMGDRKMAWPLFFIII